MSDISWGCLALAMCGLAFIAVLVWDAIGIWAIVRRGDKGGAPMSRPTCWRCDLVGDHEWPSDCIDALRAALGNVTQALRLIEWSYLLMDGDEGPYELCPRCAISRSAGHGQDCEVGAALATAGDPEEERRG